MVFAHFFGMCLFDFTIKAFQSSYYFHLIYSSYQILLNQSPQPLYLPLIFHTPAFIVFIYLFDMYTLECLSLYFLYSHEYAAVSCHYHHFDDPPSFHWMSIFFSIFTTVFLCRRQCSFLYTRILHCSLLYAHF